ncbi:hypothetical protein [Blastomonas aquatica]|uniref:Uncharacterized protein n=1 Tax=Blastomonas aquatica TaxID=1510276 RepID=A0ABQ1JIX6_9SPHN|nr:hypothetical protein [Blastomonas aquatica]GGB67652.1 hypothetical protein GCM10010833_23530 [Blastomonas aquatica]
MRIVFLFPIALLAACSSQTPADDSTGTPDGSSGNAPAATAAAGSGPSASGPATSQAAVQAVDAEGPKLEPLLSNAITEAGLVSASCRFSPAQGALPVLVASTTGGNGIISVAGRQIDVAPSGAVALTGGSFAAPGVTMMVSASGNAAGSTASMQVTGADGAVFVYRDGIWFCN